MSRKSNRSRRVKQSNARPRLYRSSLPNYATLFGSDLRRSQTSIHPFSLIGTDGTDSLFKTRVKPVLKYVRNPVRPGISAPWSNPLAPKFHFYQQTYFAKPETSTVCVRRSRRREILFASNRAGRGVKVRRPNFTELSKISCRRT